MSGGLLRMGFSGKCFSGERGRPVRTVRRLAERTGVMTRLMMLDAELSAATGNGAEGKLRGLGLLV